MSPIDFKCRKNEQWFLIDAKQNSNSGKVRLSPSQKNVDAVVMLIDGKINIIWKNNFTDYVLFDKVSLIKIPTSVKLELDRLRKYCRESYGDILSRVLSLKD